MVLPIRKIPSMEIIKKQVSELKDAPYNPRINVKDNPEFYKKLKHSIDKWGIVEPIIWNKRTGNVVGGNQRLAILQDNNVQETEVVVVDLPDNDEKALNIALNKITGDWDMPKLNDLLIGLKEADYNIADTGFDDKELNEILDEFREVVEDDFELPKEAKYKVNAGDIFQLGPHRLMCGDSTKKEDVERLMNGEKADMVFTDPPYGVDYSGGRSQLCDEKGWRHSIKNDSLTDEQFKEFIFNIFKNINEISKDNSNIYVCHGVSVAKSMLIIVQSFLDMNWHHANEIIWNKNVASLGYQDYRYRHEVVTYGWKGTDHKFFGDKKETDVWDISRDATTKYKHPTQKPIAISERAIKNSSQNNDIVLDLFGGSGSTLIACEQTQRQCRMMEIDPYYCSVIIERWEKFTGHQHVKVNA